MHPYAGGPGARVVPALFAGEEPGIELVHIGAQGEEEIVVQRIPEPGGPCGNVFWVVFFLVVLFVIFSLLFIYGTGRGKPDRGNSFAKSSDGLRNDSADRLHSARPTGWSGGAAGAAEGYERTLYEQRLRVDRAAAADQQLADIVATQATEVEQGRQDLQANLDSLASGIAVAGAMQTQWMALAATGSPAAPAVAAALAMFGKTVACTTTTSALGVGNSLTDAGERTQQTLSQIIDTYREIVDGAAAVTPSGWAPATEFYTAARPINTGCELPDAPAKAGAISDVRAHAPALSTLINQLLGGSPALRQPTNLSALTSRLSQLVSQRIDATSRPTMPLPQLSAPAATGHRTHHDRDEHHSMQDTQPSTSVPSNAI